MKKFLAVFLTLALLGFIGPVPVLATEDFPPPDDGRGVIGNARNADAWDRMISEKYELSEVAAVSTPATSGHWNIEATSDGVYVTDDQGSSTQIGAASVAWDDISNPDKNKALDFTDYYTSFDSGDADHDMFTFQGTGAFGDVSIVKIEQVTGNATDGTVLEVVSADTDADALLVTANSVDVILVNGDGTLTLTGATGLTGALTMVGDLGVTGNFSVSGTWSVDAIAAATATQTLALDGDSTGGVTIGATSLGNVTIGDDMVMSDGYNFTIGEGYAVIDNDATDETALTITSDATTSGGAIAITSAATTTNGKAISVTADGITTGDLLYLDSLAAGMTTGNFINCWNGAGTVFEVGLYGATTIAGNASTDILTITAGDIQITAGDIDLDNGQLMVNTAQDLASNIIRAYAGAGTDPVLTVKEDHTSSTNVALLVENDGTGNSTALQISHDGDYPAIDIDAGAARTGNVIDIAMANQLAEKAIAISGAATSATGEGVIEVHTTGAMAGALLRLDIDTGTPAAIDGYVLEIDDDAAAQAGKYAVEINVETNEALYVSKGLSKFTEAVTFTGGIDVDEDINVDFDNADEEVDITNSAEYGADGAQVTIYNSDADVGANAYLLRLRYADDGQANADFVVFEDNDGDDMLAINALGDIVMGGSTGTGGKFITSFEDLTGASEGVAASVVVYTTFVTTDGDGDENALTLADGVKGQVKIFVSAVEGAGGDSYKITPAHMNGGTKITFDAVVGDGCTMIFDGTSWNIISNNGGTIS